MSQRTDKDCACSEKDKGRKFLEEICVNFTSASSPTMNGKMPHIQCTADDIGEIVLLPGDPARVSMFEDLLEDYRIVSNYREYVVGTGYYNGIKITVCSTGIGAPSTEIAVIQLIALGAKALIRCPEGRGAVRRYGIKHRFCPERRFIVLLRTIGIPGAGIVRGPGLSETCV